MKRHTFKAKFATGWAFFLLAALAAWAQMPGGGTPRGMSAAMLKLFGNTTAFSARAEVQVLDKNQSQTMKMPMEFSLLDSKMRMDTDLSQMQGRNISEGLATSLKKMGLAHVISIIRPDQQTVLKIYPEHKAYLKAPMSPAEAAAARSRPALQETALGKETIEGHPCIKNRNVLTGADGGKVEAITWNATDLKGFPLQIQTQENGNTAILRFQHVQFTKPAAQLFEPPAGFTQYNDQQEMIAALSRKIEGAQGK